MPDDEYISAGELKQFLMLERERNSSPRRGLVPRKASSPEKPIRRANANDVLFAIEFIETKASEGGAAVNFRAEHVRELKELLEVLELSGKTVERMTALLDEMQSSVAGGELPSSLHGRGSHKFEMRHKQSVKLSARPPGCGLG
jgi:hypothetical protein